MTGWAGADGQGLNPAAGSPFADNGAIPDGTQVGFLQGTATFSNTIAGLTSGQQYELSFRVNARNGAPPTMSVDVGGSTLVKSDVNPVGGANPYKYVVRTFTATGATMPLNIHSTVLDGDRTLLVDDVRITEKPNAAWSVSAWTGDADSGIDSGLTYTHRYNLGAATNATINGVELVGVGGGAPSSTVAGDFSQNAPALINGDTNNITGDSATLANDFVYDGKPAVLTLSGLVDGQAYRTTIFGVAWDAATSNRTVTFEAGGERFTVDESQFDNNNGIRVDYEFVADGDSLVITYDPLGPATFHTYGFVNAEMQVIPESTTFVLAALGLLGLLGFGRRRKR